MELSDRCAWVDGPVGKRLVEVRGDRGRLLEQLAEIVHRPIVTPNRDHPAVMHSIFDLLSSPPEAYVILWALALGDAVVPILPSEAALITAGLLSVVGDLTLGWVIVAGALGAYCGDSISYGLGRFAGSRSRSGS